MKYYSLYEILGSVAGAISFGSVMGLLFIALGVIIGCIGGLFRVPLFAWRASASGNIRAYLRSLEFKMANFGAVALFFKDFTFITLFGVGFSILLYVFCDGILRLYMLFIAAFVCYAVVRIFKKPIQNITFKLLSCFFIITLCIVSVALIPVRQVIEVIQSRIILPIILWCLKSFQKRRSARVTLRKKREIKKFIMKIGKAPH